MFCYHLDYQQGCQQQTQQFKRKSGLLIKGEIIKNEAKEQKGGFFPMLLKTLTASIRGSALTGRGVIRAGERTIKACKDF